MSVNNLPKVVTPQKMEWHSQTLWAVNSNIVTIMLSGHILFTQKCITCDCYYWGKLGPQTFQGRHHTSATAGNTTVGVAIFNTVF